MACSKNSDKVEIYKNKSLPQEIRKKHQIIKCNLTTKAKKKKRRTIKKKTWSYQNERNHKDQSQNK